MKYLQILSFYILTGGYSFFEETRNASLSTRASLTVISTSINSSLEKEYLTSQHISSDILDPIELFNETSLIKDIPMDLLDLIIPYNETNLEERDQEEVEKFMSEKNEIILDHFEFTKLRLKHLAQSSPDNIQDLRKLLDEELKNNKIYRLTWNWCKVNAHTLNSTIGIYPEEYLIALMAYSTEDPLITGLTALHRDFKQKMLSICSGRDINNFEYKSLYKFFHLALLTLGRDPKYKSNSTVFYRGVKDIFVLEEGQVMMFQHVLSTSTDLSIAESFSQNNTVFEFHGSFPGVSVDMNTFTVYKFEKEVLFSPTQMFKVQAKYKFENYTKYVLIGSDQDDNQCENVSVPQLYTSYNEEMRFDEIFMTPTTWVLLIVVWTCLVALTFYFKCRVTFGERRRKHYSYSRCERTMV